MRVPKDLQECLGRKEYRRSLGTASRRDASPKALRLALALNDVFTCTREIQVMEMNGRQTGIATLKPLTAERIRELAHISLERCLQSDFAAALWQGVTFIEFSRHRDAIRRYQRVMTSIPAQYSKNPEYTGLDWDALVALDVPPNLRFKKRHAYEQFQYRERLSVMG